MAVDRASTDRKLGMTVPLVALWRSAGEGARTHSCWYTVEAPAEFTRDVVTA